MTRIKRGVNTKKRHKKLLKETKGYWGQRSNIYKRAHETLMRALAFSFQGRKLKKRDMRGLFITRISAGAKQNDSSYSTFMNGLKNAGIALNRKMLSQLAIYEPAIFTKLVGIAKG
jgi:large subunit ribosomal protein L20